MIQVLNGLDVEIASIEVMDISGRQIRQITGDEVNQIINLGNTVRGLMLVRINMADNSVHMKKVIVE